MRKLVSIFVFSAALFVGLLSVPITAPTLYENLFPFFSHGEAGALVGRRVKNKFSSQKFAGMKCTQDAEGLLVLDSEYGFTCEKIQVGETGTITGLHKIDDGFVLVIEWDRKDQYGRGMFSYDGRFSSRIFLEFD